MIRMLNINTALRPFSKDLTGRVWQLNYKVLLQFSWRRGFKDSRGPGFKSLFSKNFIIVSNILLISVMSFLVY